MVSVYSLGIYGRELGTAMTILSVKDECLVWAVSVLIPEFDDVAIGRSSVVAGVAEIACSVVGVGVSLKNADVAEVRSRCNKAVL